MQKVILPAILAPIIAGARGDLAPAGLRAHLPPRPGDRRQAHAEARRFRAGQIFTSSLVALAHGTNDAQKTMGIITLALITAGTQAARLRPAVLGHPLAGLRHRARHLLGRLADHPHHGQGPHRRPAAQGFAAETSTAAAILASSHLGFALSTTQVASGSVIGSGLGRRGPPVRWGTAGRIALGWLFTLPAAGIVGALTAMLVQTGVIGVVMAAVAGTAAVAYMFVHSRKSHVGPPQCSPDRGSRPGRAIP